MRRARPSTFLALAALIVGCGDDSPPTTFCEPFGQVLCYGGPEGTDRVGACRPGVRICDADGAEFSECVGEILPVAEDCGTALDDDCDGVVNQGCACTPGTFEKCYSGPAGTVGKGICKSGRQWCREDGLARGACEGELVPATEDCTNDLDDDCDGVVNQPEACVCQPGDVAPCYSGPAGTAGVGACVAGVQTCLPEGGAFGPCESEIVPASEDCASDLDDDCDGAINEPDAACACTSGTTRSCYGGPAATIGVGVCVAGEQTCLDTGDGFGPCIGDVVPVAEDCATPEDDDCDGVANEEDAGCECTPGAVELCYEGPPFTLNVGTCRAGTRTCNAGGHWLLCLEQILPINDDCGTPLDENCDGSVNEPTSGCDCGLEDVQSLASEDCVLDYGEPAWKKPILGLPHDLAADAVGNAYMLLRRELPILEVEAVPPPLTGSAIVARYQPNGDFAWAKEVAASQLPSLGKDQLFHFSVAPNGVVAFSLPVLGGTSGALGADSWSWPGNAFRGVIAVDPDGYLIFDAAVPRFVGESNSAAHALAVDVDASVFYANGPIDSHLIKLASDGSVAFSRDLDVDVDDLAVAPSGDGGAVVAFTTGMIFDLPLPPLLPLQPLPGSTSDLVVARFDAAGVLVWAVRPFPLTAVHAGAVEAGVLTLVAEEGLVRMDVTDGSITGLELLPGLDAATMSLAITSNGAVFYGANGLGPTDFGLGDLDPYGAQPTGLFMALHAEGWTRWARAPYADGLVVGGGAHDVLFAALRVSTTIDLDGTPVTPMMPGYYLSRLAY